MSGDDLDAGLAAVYAGARQRMTEIAGGLDAAQAAAVVPACPDWTVPDLVAHVTALASDLGAGRRPDGDTQAWVEAQVAERRGRPLADVVAEWDGAAQAFEGLIAAKPHRWWGLVYDVVAHEHDLRGATAHQGERDAGSIAVANRLVMRLIGKDLAEHDLPAFRLVVDGTELVAGEGTPELSLETSAFEALRLLGSRRTLAQMQAAGFDGDLERYLPGLVHMELPAAELPE